MLGHYATAEASVCESPLSVTAVYLFSADLEHGHTLEQTNLDALIATADLEHGHTLEGSLEFLLSPHAVEHRHLLEQTSVGGRLQDDGSGAETEVAEPAATAAHLLKITFWDGSAENDVFLTTAAQPLTATVDSTEETFTATGGLLAIGQVQETADRAAQGVELKLSGLDSSVLDPLLGQDFRGRKVSLWRVYFDQDTGDITAGPLLLSRFDQLGDYEVSETPPDFGAPGTVEITTRVESPLAALQQTNPVRSNVESHNRMLDRAGVDPPGLKDTFWQNLPGIVGKRIRWGTGDTPDGATTTTSSGGSGGTEVS